MKPPSGQLRSMRERAGAERRRPPIKMLTHPSNGIDTKYKSKWRSRRKSILRWRCAYYFPNFLIGGFIHPYPTHTLISRNMKVQLDVRCYGLAGIFVGQTTLNTKDTPAALKLGSPPVRTTVCRTTRCRRYRSSPPN